MHRLTNSNFGEASFMRNVFAANIPNDTPYEAIFDPFFWCAIAPKVSIGSKIEIFAENGSYYAEAIVIAASTQWVKVKEILKIVLNDEEKDFKQEDESFVIKWAGPHAKWRVLKKDGNIVLKDGAKTEEEANQWLKEYKKSMEL